MLISSADVLPPNSLPRLLDINIKLQASWTRYCFVNILSAASPNVKKFKFSALYEQLGKPGLTSSLANWKKLEFLELAFEQPVNPSTFVTLIQLPRLRYLGLLAARGPRRKWVRDAFRSSPTLQAVTWGRKCLMKPSLTIPELSDLFEYPDFCEKFCNAVKNNFKLY